jgi:hypothetical protein
LLSLLFLVLGFGCAAWVAFDILRHPQHMGIMNLVWPVIALSGTVFTLWLYLRYGRLATKEKAMQAKQRDQPMPAKRWLSS